jgi:hypothetical protein
MFNRSSSMPQSPDRKRPAPSPSIMTSSSGEFFANLKHVPMFSYTRRFLPICYFCLDFSVRWFLPLAKRAPGNR